MAVKASKEISKAGMLFENLKKLPKPNYSVILVILLVAASFLIGRLSAQVEYLKGGANTAAAPAAAAAQPQQPTPVPVTLDQIKGLVDPKRNIVFGDRNKKLIFVEFSDPSCPYCHIAAGKDPKLNKYVDEQSGRKQFTMISDGGTYAPPVPEMKKLVDSGKAAFVWLYANGHGNGEMATKALYCAYEKGKFWPVHDLLMSEKGYEILNGTDIKGRATTGPIVKNDKSKSGDLANFTKQVMSYNDMKNCLDSGKYDSRTAEDQALATSMGFSGTPHFFVNTQPFVGAYSFKDMESAVAGAK